MEKTIEAFKEFFFDILGFLIPGLIVEVIWIYVFNQEYDLSKVNLYLNLSLSYVFGYIIFSITLIKDSALDKISNWKWLNKFFMPLSMKSIEGELSKIDNYIVASKIMDSVIGDESNRLDNFRSRRNIAISTSPEQERKVYTFMFRAELFNQLHTIALITVMVFCCIFIYSFFSDNLSNYSQMIDNRWIFLFTFCCFVLRNGWARFYKIAMIIPFSMYIEKKSNTN